MSCGQFEPERLLRLGAGEHWHRERNQLVPPSVDNLSSIIDAEYLLAIFWEQREGAGQAPGVDGVSYRDLSTREAGECFRALTRMIHDRSYRPQAGRAVEVPKSDGGVRVLQIRSIFDKAIARAVVNALTPVLENVLRDGCMGFRPGRGVWTLLKRLIQWVDEGRTVIAQADIRKAFDTVQIADAMAAYRRVIDNQDLLWLIEVILRGEEGEARTVGIDQGCPLSPATMNIILNFAIDEPLDRAARDGAPLWARYADNIVLGCQSVTDGYDAISQLGKTMQYLSMSIKPQTERVVELRRQGARAEIMGLEIHGGHPRIRLSTRAWKNLQAALHRCWGKGPNPQRLAETVLSSWIEAAGPAVGEECVEPVVLRVHRILRRMGFRELVSAAEIRERALVAHSRWVQYPGECALPENLEQS